MTDTYDYVDRASIFVKEGNFYKAFGDGYRLPGYPLFLAIFYYFFDQPLLVARYTQIFLSSLVILFAYLTFYSITKSKEKSIIGSILIFLWVPFYYLSPILYAETCSLFLISIFTFLLSKVRGGRFYIIFLLSVNIALITYFKPNHILLVIPFCIFVLMALESKSKFQRIKNVFASLLIIIIMIIPWSFFASLNNNALIPLSTTAGINYLDGTVQVNGKSEEIRAEVKKLKISKLEADHHYKKLAFNNWSLKGRQQSFNPLLRAGLNDCCQKKIGLLFSRRPN